MSKLTSQCPFSKTLGVVKCAKLPECNAMRNQFQKYFFLKLLAGGDFPTLADHPQNNLISFSAQLISFFHSKMALFDRFAKKSFNGAQTFLKNTTWKISNSLAR